MVREGALKVFCQAALLVDMVGLLLIGSDVEWTMGVMLRWLQSCTSNGSRDFFVETQHILGEGNSCWFILSFLYYSRYLSLRK